MRTPIRRAAVAAAVATGLMLSGCGSPAVESGASAAFRENVRGIATVAAAGEMDRAAELARALRTAVTVAEGQGNVTSERAQLIQSTIDRLLVALADEAGAEPLPAEPAAPSGEPSTGAPAEQPIEPSDEPSTAPPDEAPVEPPVEAPAVPPVEAPVEAPAVPPVEAPVEAPAVPPVEAPVEPPADQDDDQGRDDGGEEDDKQQRDEEKEREEQQRDAEKEQRDREKADKERRGRGGDG